MQRIANIFEFIGSLDFDFIEKFPKVEPTVDSILRNPETKFLKIIIPRNYLLLKISELQMHLYRT